MNGRGVISDVGYFDFAQYRFRISDFGCGKWKAAGDRWLTCPEYGCSTRLFVTKALQYKLKFSLILAAEIKIFCLKL